jgi:hypothetical protein
MNISKSLKEKNRITGRLKKLQTQLYKLNRYPMNEVQDFEPADIFKAIQEEWAHLIALKTKIAHANLGIAEKLVQLTEAKAELQFWISFASYAGKHEENVERRKLVNGQYEEILVPYTSYLTSKEVQENTDRVQKLIEDLQDEVDTFNGMTNI